MVDPITELAKTGLEIGAVKINFKQFFIGGTGFKAPIYYDGRLFLYDSDNRLKINSCFENIIKSEKIDYQMIAGIATSGIPLASTLADSLEKDFFYLRLEPKPYGLKKQIEGISSQQKLYKKKVLLIDDLIATGNTAINAITHLRSQGLTCNYFFSLFNYEFEESLEEFQKLKPRCLVKSILNYDLLIDVAQEFDYITSSQVKLLKDWRSDPFNWAKNNGF